MKPHPSFSIAYSFHTRVSDQKQDGGKAWERATRLIVLYNRVDNASCSEMCEKYLLFKSLTFQEVFLYCSAISWKLYRIRNKVSTGRLMHISLETLRGKGLDVYIYHLHCIWSKNQANNNDKHRRT